MSDSIKYLLLILLAVSSFVISNQSLEANIMEARNFVTAREIIENGNWLSPTMNGELRIAKPPLPTWITAVFMQLSPDPTNLFWLRLPAAIMAALMMLFIGGLSREIHPDKNLAFIVAAVFGSSALVIEMGKIGSWDIYAQCFLLGGIWAFVRGLKKNNTAAFLLAGLAFGLSFMSKGPVAHYGLLLPFLLAYAISFKGFNFKANKWNILYCILIFCLLSFSWPLYIYLSFPEMAASVASTEAGAWIDRHSRPFYFYLHFPFYTGLWAVLIIASFFPKFAKQRFPENAHYKFYLLWALLCIFLLSVIPEKKERYMIPVMVPLAFMAGNLLYYLRENRNNLRRFDRLILKILAICVSLVLLGIGIFVFVAGYKFQEYNLGGFIAVCILISALMLFIWKSLGAKKIMLFFALLIAVTTVFNLFAFPLIPNITDKNRNYHGLNNVQKDERLKDLDLYSIGGVHIKRVWEAGKPILPYDFNNPPKHRVAVLSEMHPREYFSDNEFELIDQYDMERQNSEWKRYIYVLKNE